MKINDLINVRSIKYGANSIVLIAIVSALVIFLNMMITMLNVKWDMTPQQLYTLTNPTKGIIANLQYKIKITYLNDETKLRSDSLQKQVVDVVTNFKKQSPDVIEVNYIDPDSPNLKQQLGLADVFQPAVNDIVVQSFSKATGDLVKSNIISGATDNLFEISADQAGNKRLIGIKAEQLITRAITYVTSSYTPVIYFATGHSEFKVDEAYKKFAGFVRNSNYEIKTIDLRSAASLPADCEAVVFLNPQTDLTPDERVLLNDYMQTGGRALLLFNAPTQDIKFNNFESVMNVFNIGLNYDIVRESKSNSAPKYLLSAIIAPQENTFVQPENKSVVTVLTRSLNILKNKQEDLTLNILLKTSAQSTSENFDKSATSTGPFTVGAYTEYVIKNRPSRIAVFGNSYFASDLADTDFGSYGPEVLLKTVQWLTGSDKTDVTQTVDVKYYGRRLLDISQSTADFLIIFMSAVVPLIIFAIGLFVWLKRRHL